MRRSWGIRGVLVAGALSLAVACTGQPGSQPGAGNGSAPSDPAGGGSSTTGDSPSAGGAAPRPAAPAGSPSSAGASPDAGPSTVPPRGPAAPAQQPLVIVTHHSRPDLDLPRSLVRRILRGDATAWPGGGRVRLVAAPGATTPARLEVGSARAAVRAVTRDPDAVGVVPARVVGPQVRVVSVGGIDPVERPGRYPFTVPAAQRPGPVVTMTVVGDVMLGRRVGEAGRLAGDPALSLRPLQDRLAAADLTVGNLESTLSEAGPPRQGGDSFAAPPGVLAGLADAGFDALSLANNHVGDFGPVALVRTVRRLRSGGIATFGAGATPRRAWRPVTAVRDGVRFGFLGFNAIGETPPVRRGQPGAVSVSMPPRTGPLDRGELTRFLRAVERLDRRVDVVVVMPHWGAQYTNRPEPVQRQVARRLVAAGADLVVGGHPHWVQGAEMVGDRLVVHSLGNFVFDMDFMEETQLGVLLELTYWGGELKAADFVPYRIGADFAPRLVSPQAGAGTLRLMREYGSRAFAAR